MLLVSQTFTTLDFPDVKMMVGFTDRALRLWCIDLDWFPALRYLKFELRCGGGCGNLTDLRVLIHLRPLPVVL